MHRRQVGSVTLAVVLLATGGSAAHGAAPDPQDPLRVSVTTSPASVPAGNPVHITVVVHDPEASQNTIVIAFGDTTSQEMRFHGECFETSRGSALNGRYLYKHTYRNAGLYAVSVRVFTGSCDDTGDPPVGTGAEAAVSVAPMVVTAGPSRSNGPEQPRSYMNSGFRARVNKPVEIKFEGHDPDGFIQSIRVTDHAGRVHHFRQRNFASTLS